MFQLPHVKRLYDFVDTLTMGNHWRAYIDAFLYGCRMKNLSHTTINGYAERLGYLARFLDGKKIDIEDVTKVHLQDYVMSLINDPNISDATVNGRITIYKIFWNYLEQEDLWEKPNPTVRLKKIKAKQQIKEVLTPEQISKAAATANKKTFVGYRDYCLLMLLFDTMIRRNELLTLTIENVDLKQGLIKVLGKGNKERYVAMVYRFSRSRTRKVFLLRRSFSNLVLVKGVSDEHETEPESRGGGAGDSAAEPSEVQC